MDKSANEGRRTSLAVNANEWSAQSKRSPHFYLKRAYIDQVYKCFHCAAACIYTADEQKYELEIKKNSIYKRRIFCTACSAELHRLKAAIGVFENRWKMEKIILHTDRKFLEEWLYLVVSFGEFKPHKQDQAKVNMLRKILKT